MTSKSDWVRSNLIKDGYLLLSNLGEKRTILKISLHGSLVASLISASRNSPSWGNGDTDPVKSLFETLHDFRGNNSASWFFMTDLDGAIILIRSENPAGDIRSSGELRLWDFELFHPEQGVGQYLLLLFDDKSAGILITRSADLEISYYGPEELWQNLSSRLEWSCH